MRWTIEEKSSNVHIINFVGVRAGWEGHVLLRGDAHHDNTKNDWALEKKHLDKAKERDAPIIDVGDLFCAMQGKYDPRKDYEALKDEHKHIDYLDQLVKTAANDYDPYADNFAVMGRGNHEDSILDRLGTNLTNRLAERMNYIRQKPPDRLVHSGGYSGWVIFKFQIRKTVSYSISLYYYHGKKGGGGAPVTRGVIDTNRMAVWLDADIIVTGHSHDSWVVPIKVMTLNNNYKQVKKVQYHVRTASYKDDWGDGYGGWSVTKGAGPKPLGACWVRFEADGDIVVPKFELDLK